jgi:hypothetical protein
MQQTSQSSAVSVETSVEAVRRRNRTILLFLSLPLLAACSVTAGIRGISCLSRTLTNPRLGVLNQRQAVAMATSLCAVVAGTRCREVETSGYGSDAEAGGLRQGNEWQVSCQAGSSRYFLRLDGYRREVILIRRERPDHSSPRDTGAASEASAEAAQNGDLPAGRVSPREAQGWARRYLSLVGLPLPARARLVQDRGGYDFTYQWNGDHREADGLARELRVRVDPRDGSLEHLQNVVYQRFQGARLR